MIEAKFTSRIIKTTALLADTKVLLASWDTNISVKENIDRALEENIFGKASRSRVEDMLVIFRQRYFSDPQVGEALVTLVQGGVPASWVDPLFYYYSAQNDAILRAFVLEVIYPRHLAGHTDLLVDHLLRAIRDWVAKGKTTTAWNEETSQRVARNSMAALRDFGVLEGAAKKSIATIYLSVESFAFLAFDIVLKEGSGEKVLHSDEWKLFFLPTTGVERFFLEAHQERLLEYRAAGSVIRLEYPVKTLAEYAHVLVERARAKA